jgi:hypothetical protein
MWVLNQDKKVEIVKVCIRYKTYVKKKKKNMISNILFYYLFFFFLPRIKYAIIKYYYSS